MKLISVYLLMRFPCHQSLFFSLKVRLILIALISVPLLFCLNTIGLFLGSETLRVWELDLPNRKIRPTDCNTGKLRRIVKCIAVWACSTSLQIWGPHEFCTMSPMWPCYQKKKWKNMNELIENECICRQACREMISHSGILKWILLDMLFCAKIMNHHWLFF